MKIVIILVLLLMPNFAFAQQAFIPYTISQDDHTKFMTYLGEQPAKFSIPLMQALTLLEQKAIDDKKKQDEKEKK